MNLHGCRRSRAASSDPRSHAASFGPRSPAASSGRRSHAGSSDRSCCSPSRPASGTRSEPSRWPQDCARPTTTPEPTPRRSKPRTPVRRRSCRRRRSWFRSACCRSRGLPPAPRCSSSPGNEECSSPAPPRRGSSCSCSAAAAQRRSGSRSTRSGSSSAEWCSAPTPLRPPEQLPSALEAATRESKVPALLACSRTRSASRRRRRSLRAPPTDS